MKRLLCLLATVLVAAQSCKKLEVKETVMPRTLTSFRQKSLEVSNRKGATASVVLIGGFNSEMETWAKLYQQLDADMTVFTYNRPGIGRSANIAGKRDAATIATELKAVLEANKVRPPYVFVAHSMGGIYARMFYHQNPSLVKGLVLVDATHERQLDTLLSMLPDDKAQAIVQEMEREVNKALAALPSGSMKEEFRSNYRENYEQIKQYPAISNIPVYVLTSTKPGADGDPTVPTVAAALHSQWAASAGSKGKFVATDKSGHYIQVEEPALVAQGIKWVMQ